MSLFNRLVVAGVPLIPRRLVGRFSRKYIAGPALDDAIRVVRELNAAGVAATVDVLGEDITREDEARRTAAQYRAVLDAMASNHLDANISIKLTALGLKIDRNLCLSIVREIAAAAREEKSFVRLDMEDASCTTGTIDIFRTLRREFDNIGIVVQSRLRRTVDDVAQLTAEGANFRLCKGIYLEPHRIAWTDPEIIRSNYVALLDMMFAGGSYAGIATHDELLVWHALRLARERSIPKDRFEFQMLLGVTPALRSILVDAGYRVRVYVPFGEQWYAYSVRRLKENPQIAGYALRGILGLS